MERESCRTSLVDWPSVDAPIRVRDSAETAFRLIDLMADPDIDGKTRFGIAVMLLFEHPERVSRAVPDLESLVTALMWDVAMIDMDGAHGKSGEKVIDWDQDRAYIDASLRQAYGKGLAELMRETTLRELVSLVAMCPFETPIGQALHYRTAKAPDRKKVGEEAYKQFKERKRFWALKKDEISANDAATAAIRAFAGKG